MAKQSPKQKLHVLDGLELLDALNDAISVQDTNFVILYQNPAHKKLMGDHAGEYCYAAYHSKSEVCDGCHLVQSFSDGLTHRRKISSATSLGMRSVEISSSPVRDASGTIIAGIELIRDVTERERDREMLDYVNECFTQALNGSQHVLYRLNVKKGCYDYLSPAFEKITGYPIAEFKQNGLDRVLELFHPDDLPRIIACIDDATRTRSGTTVNLDLEYRLRKADGSYCWLHDSTTACFNENNELECYFGSANDISDRYRAEELLKISEERYRRLVEQSSAWIWEVDAGLRHTYSNQFAVGLLGYSLAELQQKDLSELIHPDDSTAIMELAETARRLGQGWRGKVLRWRTKDGRYLYLESSGSPLFDENGRFAGLSGIDIDVTARVLAEENLKRSEQSLRSIIDANPESHFLIELDGTISMANRSLARRFDTNVDELQGHNFAEFGPPDLHTRRVLAAEKVISTGMPQVFMDTRAGMELENHVHPVFDQHGRVSKLAVLSIDVTEKNMLQRQRMNIQKLESFATIAHGFAHNFNNALTSVLGYISLSRMSLDSTHKAFTLMESAEDAAKKAVTLVSQLKVFLKGSNLIEQQLSVVKLVEDAVYLSTKGSKVTGRVELPESLHAIYGDEKKLLMAFNAICANAVEAMPDGGVLAVRGRNVDAHRDKLPVPIEGHYIEISFEDQGYGIPDSDTDKIFTPFFTHKAEVGAGLSLAAAHSIITQHGGAITFVSKVGIGTAFTIYLPAVAT